MEPTTRFFPWLREHIDRFSGLLFDIDGTLIRDKVLLAGARETLDFIAGHGIPYLFLTNDAVRSHEEKSRILQALELPVPPELIVSCGDALQEFAEQRRVQGERFFIMGRLGEPNYAEIAGLRITRDCADLPRCRGVIIGETGYDWESTFNAVLNYFIEHPDGLLVVPNPDDYFVDRRHQIHIAPGAKAAFLTTLLTRWNVTIAPIALGKPYTPIFDYARHVMARRYGLPARLDPRSMLMVGDSLTADIAGANRAGLSSCLLLTGVTSPTMLEQLPDESRQRPTCWFQAL